MSSLLLESPAMSKMRTTFSKEKKGYLTFIVKPDCLSQGKGIFLTNNVEEVFTAANNSSATNERIVV